MLKRIPPIISPELIKTLMEMGHGDEICIADGNFPAYCYGKKVIHMDGHGVLDILEAILRFFPLDTNMGKPVILMACADKGEGPPGIWENFRNIILSGEESGAFSGFRFIQRLEFYNRASSCFAVIATSEKALYANIILRKGVI